MRFLSKNDPAADFRFWGGDLMKAEGGTLVRHYKDHDFMGLVEVVKHLPTILGNISFCKKDIASYKPDAVIFIDFPGFNLRLLKYVKSLGFKIFYYISPTVWAWNEKRAGVVKRYVDHMFCIFPFEKAFYADRHGYKVDFVGHPLLDSIQFSSLDSNKESFIKEHNLPAKRIVALLPGSRHSEIRENLTMMQSIVTRFPDCHFVVAGMKHFSLDFYRQYIHDDTISVLFGKTYQLLAVAEAAVVVSGSATLETAIIGTPQVVVFKTNPITFTIGKLLVKVKFLGLPNIIMGRKIVPEFLQADMTSDNIASALDSLLNDDATKRQVKEDYARLVRELGGAGASRRVADLVTKYMNISSNS
jgi:lipid-A-disaccharide synthase